MANELTLSASMQYEDTEGSDESLSLEDILVSITTKKYTKYKMNIGTSEEALPLGEVSSLGYCLIVNRDTTNFVEIRVATAGAKMVKILAGNFALFQFGSGVTAPYAIADTAACQIEVFLIST